LRQQIAAPYHWTTSHTLNCSYSPFKAARVFFVQAKPLPAKRVNTRQTSARIHTSKNTTYLMKGKDAYVPY
jgi:hypothetical protein